MFFWRKKEILVTFSLDDFNRVKDILAANHIPYDWKTVPDCGGRGSRRFGTAFMDESVLRQYYLYVEKKEYERAEYLVKTESTGGNGKN